MILIFNSTTAALNAESLLEQWGLDVEPVPNGLALAVSTQEPELCVKALTVAGLTLVIPAAEVQHDN